ncbi:MAG TPA: hypothetical protein VGL99_25925 [Chloroflexota bacterium]
MSLDVRYVVGGIHMDVCDMWVLAESPRDEVNTRRTAPPPNRDTERF